MLAKKTAIKSNADTYHRARLEHVYCYLRVSGNLNSTLYIRTEASVPDVSKTTNHQIINMLHAWQMGKLCVDNF